MLYALGCALLALRQAFASPYMFADDAREHLFWMARYLDPALFRGDPSADYFQSLAPAGYASFYWLLARAGVDPLLASKWLPAGLSLVAAAYFFGLARHVLRSPAAASLTTIFFIQCVWLSSDLSSATPRAFFYPLFAAFLYYQVRGSMAGVLATVTLEALFFPPAALLSLGVLAWECWRWENGPRLVRERRVYLLVAAALALTLLCLLPYQMRVGTFGPLVTYDAARLMPEFGPNGRVPFFFSSWWDYWVGGNGGVHNLPTRPPWFLAAFLWPVLRRFPDRFPLLRAIPRGVRPIPQVIAAALSLFALSHLLLFHLYLPNRYTQAPTRVVLVLLGGAVLLALVDGALRWAEERRHPRDEKLVALGLAIALLLVAAYPLLLPVFPTGGYLEGKNGGLYRFFARQPATIRIASLADEANNLPLLCRRTNIVGAECAVPFHPGYYLPLRARAMEIARAQYSGDLHVLQQCLREQRVDYWLLDRAAFSERYWKKSRLLRQLRLSAPEQSLGESKGAVPFLKRPPPGAVAYEDSRFLVLDARRLLALPAGSAVEAVSP